MDFFQYYVWKTTSLKWPPFSYSEIQRFSNASNSTFSVPTLYISNLEEKFLRLIAVNYLTIICDVPKTANYEFQ